MPILYMEKQNQQSIQILFLFVIPDCVRQRTGSVAVLQQLNSRTETAIER